MKYIMFENGDFIIFPNSMDHKETAEAIGGPVSSAGFVKFKVVVETYGHSKNLDKWFDRNDGLQISAQLSYD